MPGERDTSPAEVPFRVEGEPADAPSQADRARSVLDDVEDLLVNVRTWFDAEVAYQKTRVGFVGSSLKALIGLAVGAAVFGLLLLVALTVGLLIALTPLVTAWGATAIVVAILGVVIFLLLRTASARWRDMMDAVREGREG